jgi:hypothetical protein
MNGAAAAMTFKHALAPCLAVSLCASAALAQGINSWTLYKGASHAKSLVYERRAGEDRLFLARGRE